MWLLQQWVVYFLFQDSVRKSTKMLSISCSLWQVVQPLACACLKVFKVVFSTKHRMFSVMLNVAMREGEGAFFFFFSRDNNMHKEQCIGPGRWASPWWFPVCFSGSVYQQIHYCKQLVMGESGGERGGEKRGKGRVLGSKPEWVAPSCGRTVFLSLSAMLSGSLQSKSNKFLRKRERAREKEIRLGRGGDASVAALTQSAVTSAWRFSFSRSCFFFSPSPVCYAQFRSSRVFTAEPFPTHNRPGNDHSEGFHNEFFFLLFFLFSGR